MKLCDFIMTKSIEKVMSVELQERSILMKQYLADLLLCIYAFQYKRTKFFENFKNMTSEEVVVEKTVLNTHLDSIYLRLANLADRDSRVYSFPQLKKAFDEATTDSVLLNQISIAADNLYNNHLKILNENVRNKYIAHIGENFERIWSLWKDDEHNAIAITKDVLEYFDLLTQNKNTFPTQFGHSHNPKFDMRSVLFAE